MAESWDSAFPSLQNSPRKTKPDFPPHRISHGSRCIHQIILVVPSRVFSRRQRELGSHPVGGNAAPSPWFLHGQRAGSSWEKFGGFWSSQLELPGPRCPTRSGMGCPWIRMNPSPPDPNNLFQLQFLVVFPSEGPISPSQPRRRREGHPQVPGKLDPSIHLLPKFPFHCPNSRFHLTHSGFSRNQL